MDLVAVKKSGGCCGVTEIHVANGASNFANALLHTTVPVEINGNNFDFIPFAYHTGGVLDGSVGALFGVMDMIIVKKFGTASNSTELHVLDYFTNYQSYLLHSGTLLHQTDDSFVFAFTR